jgi:hypothetical protein
MLLSKSIFSNNNNDGAGGSGGGEREDILQCKPTSHALNYILLAFKYDKCYIYVAY